MFLKSLLFNLNICFASFTCSVATSKRRLLAKEVGHELFGEVFSIAGGTGLVGIQDLLQNIFKAYVEEKTNSFSSQLHGYLPVAWGGRVVLPRLLLLLLRRRLLWLLLLLLLRQRPSRRLCASICRGHWRRSWG